MAKSPDSEVLFDAATGKNALKRGDGGKFTKGTAKGGGRKKGTPNKVSADAKKLMDALVEHGLEDAIKVYDRLKKKQPRAALLALARFAEFRIPKLARNETTGPNGGPQVIEKRVYVSAASPSEKDQVAAQLYKDKE